MSMTEQDIIRAMAFKFLPQHIQDMVTEMCAKAAIEAGQHGLATALGDDVILLRNAMCDYLYACIRDTADQKKRMN